MSIVGLFDTVGTLAGLALAMCYLFLRFRPLSSFVSRMLMILIMFYLLGEAGDMFENFGWGEWFDNFTEYTETLLPLGWFIVMMTLINDRKSAVLSESEERMRLLVESTEDIIIMQDEEGRYLYYNGPERYGLRPMDVVGRKPSDLHNPSTAEDIMDRIARVRKTGEPVTKETKMEIGGRTQYFLDQNSLMRDRAGNVLGTVAICRNITDLKTTEEKLREALAQKDVLLKEVHHRVKNNLQMISSILDLQAAKAPDNQSEQLLRESQARLRAMALIHERLYQSNEHETLDFAPYARFFTEQILQSQESERGGFEVKFDLCSVILPTEVAIPMGVILHELLSNTVKHAFPSGWQPSAPTRPKVSLVLRIEGNLLTMKYGDNGVGMPAGIDPSRTGTLGMLLINSLVRQLHGEASFTTDEGTSWLIKVPLSG